MIRFTSSPIQYNFKLGTRLILAQCTRADYFNGPFVKSEKLSQVASSSSADKKMSQEDFYDFTADLQLQRGRESLYFIILKLFVKKRLKSCGHRLRKLLRDKFIKTVGLNPENVLFKKNLKKKF